MLFRCLVPAEATALIVGEDGIARQIEESSTCSASISVSDEGDTPGLSDRIITIRGDQKHGEVACKMIIERLYAAQEVAAGDQGIFVLLAPDTFPESEDLLQKVMDTSGADVHLELDAVAGTDDRAIQIVGGFDSTVAAVFQLGALMALNHGDDGLDCEDEAQLEATYFQQAVGFENADDRQSGSTPKGPKGEERPTSPKGEEKIALPEAVDADAVDVVNAEDAEPEEAALLLEAVPSKAPPDSPEVLETEPLEEGQPGEVGAVEGAEESQEIEFLDGDEIEEVKAVAPDAGPRRKHMSVRFAVSAGVAAWVVGKKGQSITNLRSRSKAKIEVSNDGSAYRAIDINADEDAVMLAIELLLEQVSKLPDGCPEFVRIVLPPNSAGYIIGKGGETIKELRRVSGAELDLDKDMGSEKLLKIRGSQKAMTHAAQLVAQRVAEVTGDRQARSEFEKLQALLTETDHVEVSLTMLISADAVNKVSRARLYEVERLTGSHIEVDGLGGRTSGLQQLQISGTRNGNAMAIFHLQEIFAEHLRSTVKGPGQASQVGPERRNARSKSAPRSNRPQNRPSSRGPQVRARGRGVSRQ
ncbi:unnamed protein product [Durusdinium trenchii]|uniref:Far upstream element-binding protein 1 (FBP) (FUSE-binding protein 1) n=2 Tax=Durusdinium trenchii TaxID=1381693 RepID=A0ABP0QF96_9DINO